MTWVVGGLCVAVAVLAAHQFGAIGQISDQVHHIGAKLSGHTAKPAAEEQE